MVIIKCDELHVQFREKWTAMFSLEERVEPKTTPSPLSISESAVTGVAFMIFQSTATQFSSMNLASAVNHIR